MDTRLAAVSADQRLMEWAELVAECRRSEMSCKEWCRQHGISERRYYYWQKRVFDRAILQRAATAASVSVNDHASHFVELPAPQGSVQERAGNPVASIQVGRASVNLYAGADPQLVQTICQVLTSC